MDKKLQVFVSSTYKDMEKERQAVIEAILRAGHIPAGMELFAAGDKSQLEIIKQWIKDSDAFMLILGGRYGAIEPDSGKSYIQVEYEYASGLDMPYFAAVMHDDYKNQKVKAIGLEAVEQVRPDLLAVFRGQVTAKICRFFKTTEELKLIVLESLLDIEHHRSTAGWIRAEAFTNPAPLIEQIGQLQRENSQLQEQLRKATEAASQKDGFLGYDFEQLARRLAGIVISLPQGYATSKSNADDRDIDALSVFWNYRKEYCIGLNANGPPLLVWLVNDVANELALFGLVEIGSEKLQVASGPGYFSQEYPVRVVKASHSGLNFISRLDRDVSLREELVKEIEVFAVAKGP